jgi:hypothetical protein
MADLIKKFGIIYTPSIISWVETYGNTLIAPYITPKKFNDIGHWLNKPEAALQKKSPNLPG